MHVYLRLGIVKVSLFAAARVLSLRLPMILLMFESIACASRKQRFIGVRYPNSRDARLSARGNLSNLYRI
jgi:hypothetical protein